MKGLKIILWICGIYCLSGFLLAALPWNYIINLFDIVGIQPPASQPIIVFMLRVGTAIFGLIGVFLIILARNPLKYGVMLLLAAYGLVFYGLIILIGGIRYGLPAWLFSGDVIIGFVAGLLLLYFRNKAISSETGEIESA